DLGAADRGVLLVEDADGGGGEEEVEDALFVGRGASAAPTGGAEFFVVVEDGGDDAGGAVGRRGDHPPAGRVLLVDREREQVDPVQGGQRVGVVGARDQFRVQPRRAPLHVQAAGQGGLGADAALHAGAHRFPDLATVGTSE